MSAKLKHVLLMVFLLILFSGYFFYVKFNFFDFGTFYPSILLLTIIGISGKIVDARLRFRLFIAISPLLIILIISIVSFLINAPNSDYFFIGAIFLMIAVGFSSFGFFSIFSRSNSTMLIIAVVCVLILNAVLMILMFLFPLIQFGYLKILSGSGFENFGGVDNALDSMYQYRMIGFSGFASYATGFIQVIGLFFLTVYYKLKAKIIDVPFFFASILLIISALLSARSSLVGVFFWIVFCLIFFKIRFLKLICLASIFIFIFLLIFINAIDENGAIFFTSWLLEFFINEFGSQSLAETISMLDTPFADAGFLGFSRWYGELGYDYFRGADVGFIRLILVGGFVSLILILIHFFLMGFLLIKKDKSYFFSTLYFFLMVYFTIIMFKGAIFFDFFAFDFLMLMLCWVSQNKE